MNDHATDSRVPLETVLARKFGIPFTRTDVLRALDRLPTIHHSDVTLPDDESRAYEEAGFVEDPDAYRRRMVSSTVAYTALLATALTTEQAADRLGVDPSRIRQRIAERTVWAIKDGRRWLLPAVQFDGNRMVRGLDTLLPLLLQGEHPLTVQGLLTTSQAVLAVDGEPESILDWLRSGGDIAAAAAVVDAHRWAAV